MDNLILLVANKYDAYESSDEEKPEEIEVNISPEVVLSETFING
ncbi:hypothetical protein ACRQ5D_31740 [Mucilaginibacter sp. P25]